MRRWLLCCSALVALAAGPATARAQADAGLATRARLLRVGDTRRDEPAFLDSALASTSPGIRSLAALITGRLGGPAHRGALRALATDRDDRVAADALFALALVKDTASIATAAAALHGAPAVAARAAWLLGQIGEPARADVVAGLASAVTDSTRGALLLAAARLRPVPASAIAPWVSSPDPEVAWRAAYALQRGRSPAGVRTLLAVARSTHAVVREQAARGLGHGVAGDSLADSAVAALRLLVIDADPHVRIGALRALASYRRLAREPVVHALRDADPAVRLTAAQSLDAVLDSAVTPWRDAMEADTAFVVRRSVAEGAARHGVADAFPASWRRASSWQPRAAAAEIDAIGGADVALPRAVAFLGDLDGRVRAAAASAVARLADSTVVRTRARMMLRQLLRDADPQVRAAALAALANGADSDDLALALDAYDRSRRDREADARLAFWQLADSALGHLHPLPDSIDRRLSGLAMPTDPLERAAAAHLTRFAAWGGQPGTPRPLAWYVQRARESLAARQPIARLRTERGTIEIALFGADAPLTVYNFVALARAGYFDGQRFHRVVPDFVAQAGDPRGDGNGGPGYAIRDELNSHRYVRGTVGMALSGPDTGGSQFFITHSPQPHLDGGYTVFGQLLSGGPVLDRIVQGDRIVRITIH